MKITNWIIIIILFTSCNSVNNSNENQEKLIEENSVELSADQLKEINGKTENTQFADYSASIKCTGKIGFPNSFEHSIHSPIEGIISDLPYKVEGNSVKKGEELCRIKNLEIIKIQRDYAENYSNLKKSEAEFVRLQSLLKENSISKKEFDMAEAEFMKNKAYLLASEKSLEFLGISIQKIKNGIIEDYISIKSPSDGIITEININSGFYANNNTLLFKIQNRTHPHLELEIFSKDINKISVGDSFNYTLSSNPNQVFKGVISVISSQYNNNSSIRVHGHPITEPSEIKNAEFLNAEINIKAIEAIRVGKKSLISEKEKNYVLILEKNKLSKVEVVVLGEDQNWYYLEKGDGIISKEIIKENVWRYKAWLETSEEE